MPERARAVVLASTGTGDIIPDATVTVRNPGTTTNISETIFANDDPDTTQLTNGVFKTDARGLAIFYLTDQKRVDVLFTKAGVTSVTIPVDVQKSALVSGYGVVMDEATTLTQRGTLRFTGDGVTATDDAANGRTNVTIGGGDIATATFWDAAGDLAKGTGADTAARLARGSANQILRVNSGGTDIEWGAAGLTQIATSTLGGDAASITFSSIPSTYSHLVVECQGRLSAVAANAEVYLRFNGDGATNYDASQIEGTTAAVNASGAAGVAGLVVGRFPAASATASRPGHLAATIYNYKNTTFFKTLSSHGGRSEGTAATDQYVRLSSGLWRSTAAITQVSLHNDGTNFIAGTTATLYGLA